MEECQKCKDIGYDRRTLWMSCFYDMDEIGIPLSHEILKIKEDSECSQKFYTMRVCKTCRGLWMAMMKFWYDLPDNKHVAHNSGIFVRELGATIEISEEEWYRRHPGVEPVRFKEE